MTTPLVGLNLSTSATADADPLRDARAAEELGFDFISANDHPGGGQATNEVWTLLSWIAANTTRIRVATRVLGVPWRHPAVLAKMAETLHRLSGGRLILGLGGGAMDDEFRRFGIDVRSPRDKVAGLGEAIELMRALWSEQRVTYDGRLYRTDDARLEPKPSPPIPIWLGTFGDRALELTGRLADGWIPSYDMAPPDRAIVMRDRIMAAAAVAGRAPEDITCVYNIVVRIDDGAPSDPERLSGGAEAIAESLVDFTRIGFSAFNLIPTGGGLDEQVERLGREVLPAVRGAFG